MRRAWGIVVLAGVALALPASGEEPKAGGEAGTLDPTEILKKADAAAKAVKSVSYKAEFAPQGFLKERADAIKGTAVISKEKGEAGEKWRVEGTMTPRGSAEKKELAGGCDGENYYLIDHAAKKVYVDLDPGVMGRTGQRLAALRMLEYSHPTPFEDEINADEKTLRGTPTIAGEECYEIAVKYSGGRGEAVWYFSKNDYLPRRVDRVFANPSGGEKAHTELTLSEVKVDPPLTENPFKLAVPEGYEQVDDFAP